MKFICPLLVVADLERSKQFYQEVMDQKILYDFGENVTFKGDFAIHDSDHYSGLLAGCEVRFRGHNMELYFEFDDVDAFHQKIKDQVEVIHPPVEQPWRQKVMRFYDPDGHVLEVGESLEHTAVRLLSEQLSEEEIAAILNLSVDFVRSAAQSQLNNPTERSNP